MAYLNEISVSGTAYELRQKYPVGAVYLSTDAASPASLFGGTWERIAEGRALFGAGTLGDDTYTAGQTVDAGLPNITGSAQFDPSAGYMRVAGAGGAFYGGSQNWWTKGTIDQSQKVNTRLYIDASRSSAVYGNSDTVQPNAYVVYMWRRTA